MNRTRTRTGDHLDSFGSESEGRWSVHQFVRVMSIDQSVGSGLGPYTGVTKHIDVSAGARRECVVKFRGGSVLAKSNLFVSLMVTALVLSGCTSNVQNSRGLPDKLLPSVPITLPKNNLPASHDNDAGARRSPDSTPDNDADPNPRD